MWRIFNKLTQVYEGQVLSLFQLLANTLKNPQLSHMIICHTYGEKLPLMT